MQQLENSATHVLQMARKTPQKDRSTNNVFCLRFSGGTKTTSGHNDQEKK
jgi:hypothetical protein